MSAPGRQLPLFPLDTVLFPGGLLALQIFEPRYQALLRDCLDSDRRFGVVLIAAGQEVGPPALPHGLGTIAEIRQVEPPRQGLIKLVAGGEERFTIERHWLSPAGYLVGQIHPRADRVEPSDHLTACGQTLRDVLTAYIARLAPEATTVLAELEQTSDPVRIGGLAATLLRVDNQRKQTLLELDSASQRLRGLQRLLEHEEAILRLLARSTEAALEREIVSPN